MNAGAFNLPTVFLFSDTQIVNETFLDDINNVLNSGEVPNLFEPDEIERIIGGKLCWNVKCGNLLFSFVLALHFGFLEVNITGLYWLPCCDLSIYLSCWIFHFDQPILLHSFPTSLSLLLHVMLLRTHSLHFFCTPQRDSSPLSSTSSHNAMHELSTNILLLYLLNTPSLPHSVTPHQQLCDQSQKKRAE